MSIVTLKKKTAAKLGLSSGKNERVKGWMIQGPYGARNPTYTTGKGFSLNGGTRNIGGVGIENLAKSVTRTPFRGPLPVGHGTLLGKYPVVIHNSGSCCTNDSNIIKPSVINTKGMLAKKYKWINGGHMNTLQYSDGTVWNPNWWVDSTDSNYSLDQEANSQILKKKSQNLRYRSTNNKHENCTCKDKAFDKRMHNYVKNPIGAISNSENLEFLQHDCIAPDSKC